MCQRSMSYRSLAVPQPGPYTSICGQLRDSSESAAVLILLAIGRYEIRGNAIKDVRNAGSNVTPFTRKEARIGIAERLENPQIWIDWRKQKWSGTPVQT